MRLLLLGSSGQVGYELRRVMAPGAEIVAPGRELADFNKPKNLAELVAAVRPDIVINAVAYTDVEQAESDRATAQRVNADAPAALAAAARDVGALFVHYSTDYVFDGTRATPRQEDAPTNPLNVYGRTKLAGEQAVAAQGGDFLLFRVSWIYGLRRRNFMTTMRRLAAERGSLQVVHDQFGCPTWCGTVATATAAAIAAGVNDGGELLVAPGVYHLACHGMTSWCGFARAFLPAAVAVEEVTSAEFPSRAVRPVYSVLDGRHFEETFGVRLPTWQDALKQCLQGGAAASA